MNINKIHLRMITPMIAATLWPGKNGLRIAVYIESLIPPIEA